MRDDLELNLDREVNIIGDITSRLSHKKECRIGITRVHNKLQNAINLSYQLLESGRLHAEGEVEAITSIVRLKEYMEHVKERDIYVLDLETTGLDVFNDIIVGVCMYTPHETSVYIPINHTDINNIRVPEQLDENEVFELLKPYITDKEIKTIGHNIKYDGKVLMFAKGWTVGNFYFDTLIGGHLLNEEEPHGLKDLYWKYCKKKVGSNEDFYDLFGDTPFNYIPIEVAKVYGANDGYKNYFLYEFQKQFLYVDNKKKDMAKIAGVLFEIEMPLVPILIDIELRGVTIRVEFAEELAGQMRGELVAVEEMLDLYVYDFIEKIADNPILMRLTRGIGKINYSSPLQVQTLLYDVWRLKKPTSRGKKEVSLTGEDTLLKHKATGQKRGTKKAEKFIEFIDNLLELRFLTKMLSTYVEKIPRIIEPKTGAVHTNFNQTGTKTGRFSSSHPLYKLNLQNIPSKEKRIRKMFKAREGYKLIGGDFSQIEPRTLASISGDEEMINAYKQGMDLYALMASKVYGMDLGECKEFRPDGSNNPEGKMRRDSMKSVLLGIMYERGEKSIAEQFKKSMSWALDLVAEFKKSYPKIELLRKYYITHAETYGWVSTVDGRKRRLKDMQISDHDNFRYQCAHRQVLNAVVQGTAGDAMKRAMVIIGQSEELKALDFHMLMTIHDELICECKEESVSRALPIFERLMKKAGEDLLGLPMSVDCEVTDYWYGANQVDMYVA